MLRTPRRSSSRPKHGVTRALTTKWKPNAVDSVPRPKPGSSVIGLMKRLALKSWDRAGRKTKGHGGCYRDPKPDIDLALDLPAFEQAKRGLAVP